MGNIIAGITDPIISQTCALAPEVCALIPGIITDITDAPTMSPTLDTCPDASASVGTCPAGQLLAQVTYDPTQCTGGDDEYDSLDYFVVTFTDYLALTGSETLEDLEAASPFSRTCLSPQETLVDNFCLPSDGGYLVVLNICPSLPDTKVGLENAFKFELLEGDGVTLSECSSDLNADGSEGNVCIYQTNQP